MKRPALTTLVLCTSMVVTSSLATTWPQLTLEDLYTNSDVVVFALITSADLVRVSADPEGYCGVNYVGDVRDSFKGRYAEGGKLVFGRVLGLEVGREYLLFLNEDEIYEPIASISSPQAQARIDRREWYKSNCESMPNLSVNFAGRGALPVVWTLRWRSRGVQDAVLTPRRYITLPIQVPKGPYGDLDETFPSDHDEWTVANKDRLEKQLVKLRDKKNNSP